MVLALAAALFFLSIWIVVPAPTMTLLTFSVGAPEVSPLLLGPAVITILLAWRRRRDRAGRVALGLSAVAGVLFAIPLVQYPRSVPLSATTLLAGVDMGQSRLIRGVEF